MCDKLNPPSANYLYCTKWFLRHQWLKCHKEIPVSWFNFTRIKGILQEDIYIKT